MSLNKIRVLIVDDSAFARKVIREVLERDPEIEIVGIARDGLDAIEKIAELKPDVITLDLVMPDLDGLGVLRTFQKGLGPKALIVSVSGSESELVLEALHLGAVDVVTKPTAFPTDRLYDLSTELIAKVKAAASSKVREQVQVASVPVPLRFNGKTKLVALGTSTGGPQAITEIFKTLPADFPVPLVIALHIPAGYTAPLAARISKTSHLPLVEAYNGMELLPAQAVIAPGGQHLKIKQMDGKFFAFVSVEPLDSLYHPSIDLLFESVAQHVGDAAIGVILTGMGSDGTKGSQAIKLAGGRIIAESEKSCVVYGMPRSVIEAGAADAEAPLEQIPNLLMSFLSTHRP